MLRQCVGSCSGRVALLLINHTQKYIGDVARMRGWNGKFSSSPAIYLPTLSVPMCKSPFVLKVIFWFWGSKIPQLRETKSLFMSFSTLWILPSSMKAYRALWGWLYRTHGVWGQYLIWSSFFDGIFRHNSTPFFLVSKQTFLLLERAEREGK